MGTHTHTQQSAIFYSLEQFFLGVFFNLVFFPFFSRLGGCGAGDAIFEVLGPRGRGHFGDCSIVFTKKKKKVLGCR